MGNEEQYDFTNALQPTAYLFDAGGVGGGKEKDLTRQT